MIFLDIDGVLAPIHRWDRYGDLDSACIQVLNEIVAGGAFPEAMEQFFGLPFGDEVRRKILWDNCARLYNIETPAAALTKDAYA